MITWPVKLVGQEIYFVNCLDTIKRRTPFGWTVLPWKRFVCCLITILTNWTTQFFTFSLPMSFLTKLLVTGPIETIFSCITCSYLQCCDFRKEYSSNKKWQWLRKCQYSEINYGWESMGQIFGALWCVHGYFIQSDYSLKLMCNFRYTIQFGNWHMVEIETFCYIIIV